MMQGNGTTKTVFGALQEVIYQRGRFVVALVRLKDQPFLVAPERFVFSDGKSLMPDVLYAFTGRLVLRKGRGLQFLVDEYAVQSAPRRSPTSPMKPLLDALVAGEVPSIGAGTGRRLVAGFGEDLLTMRDPSALTALDGIGDRKAVSILANIKRYLEDELNR